MMVVAVKTLLLASLAVMMICSLTAGHCSQGLPANTTNDGQTDTCPQVQLLRGRDGRDGRDGVRGETGPQGPKGDTGVPGLQGEQGPRGPQGRDGGKGERGAEGAKGDTGEAGTRGLPGDQGERGLAGVRGPPGISGPRGPVGDRGSRGSPGVPGAPGEAGPQAPATGGGTVYIRWGRISCPTDQVTQLAYSGRAGGTHFNENGGAADLLCLPDDPEYSRYESGAHNSALRGAEYRVNSQQPFATKHSHNIPCAVCCTSMRSKLLVIPAKLTCPTNWTTEYTGYLMAAYSSNNGRTLFKCIDDQPQSVPGLNVYDANNARYFHVEATCNSLSCPPYSSEKEVTCVGLHSMRQLPNNDSVYLLNRL